MRLVMLSILMLAPPAAAATFDRDDRVAVTQPDARLLPIGIVKGGRGVAYATGFLVDDCHVLTVKHAAGRVAAVAGRRMNFTLPFAGPEGASAGSVVAAGDLDLVADPNRLDRSQDWLLLRLDHCLGRRFGSLALAPEPAETGPDRRSGPAALFSAGFPNDQPRRRQLTIDPACRVRGGSGPLMIHDCSSLPGNSGSPIFAHVSRGGRSSIHVVAMHSTATVTRRILPFRGEDASVATRMADIVPFISAHLSAAAATRAAR